MDATTIKASVLEEGSTALASHPLPRQMGSPWQAPFLRSRPGWMPPPAPCFCVDRVLVDLSYAGSGLFLPRLGIMLLNLAQALPRAATLPGWLGPRAVAARVEPKHPLRKYLPPLIAVAPCLPGCEACACGGLLGPHTCSGDWVQACEAEGSSPAVWSVLTESLWVLEVCSGASWLLHCICALGSQPACASLSPSHQARILGTHNLLSQKGKLRQSA